jgi:hypothetical protein
MSAGTWVVAPVMMAGKPWGELRRRIGPEKSHHDSER